MEAEVVCWLRNHLWKALSGKDEEEKSKNGSKKHWCLDKNAGESRAFGGRYPKPTLIKTKKRQEKAKEKHVAQDT